MNTNSEYNINNVAISGNGINELYLDIEWEGDDSLDYYELRVLDRNKEYVESCAFAAYEFFNPVSMLWQKVSFGLVVVCMRQVWFSSLPFVFELP